MKTKLIASLLALAMLVAPVFAVTEFHQHWSGNGANEVNIETDDSDVYFYTEGNHIYGDFYFTDAEDNPYGYGIDTDTAKTKAYVEDGGIIEYGFRKNTNKESMYGEAGQESYTYITTSDTGFLGWRTNSNYARMRNSNYGWQSNDQITATGSHYIYHSLFIDDSYNEGAKIEINADGTTSLTSMCEDHWGSSYKFGKGCGCYTNAHVDISGSGTFDLRAYADNEIVTDNGITTDGFLGIHSEFNNGFHFNNFALEGN